jgi:signal transduction histidine kinase
MLPKNLKDYTLEKRLIFISSLLVPFVLIFGVAFLFAYHAYKDAVGHAVRSNETRANLLARIFSEHERAALAVVRSYANRPLVIDSFKKKDIGEATRHLSNLIENNPEIEMAYLTDPMGTLWIHFPIFWEGFNQNFSDRDWYKGVSKEWKPYVSSVDKLIIGEKDLGVTLCSPIRDQKGKVIGVLAGAQTTTFLNKILAEFESEVDAKITLIDQDGHIILSNLFPYKKEVITYPSFEFVGKARKGERGNIKIKDASKRDRVKFVSFAPVQGIGWSVIVEKEGSDIFQSIFPYLMLIALISLLTFGVVVLSLAYLKGRQKQMVALNDSENRLRVLATQLLTTQESERKLVAGEIHDSIGSSLAVVKFKVEEALQQAARGVVTSESLKSLMSTVQHAIEESRRIQTNLRPSMLDDLGILTTLDWHCREFQKTFYHICIEKEIDISEADVPHSLKIVIYRICQEALNNISKHSKANFITLSLRKNGSSVELTVQDNGEGFDVGKILSTESSRKGFGLGNMRERAELSGGSLSIESSAGSGTVIRATWPIEQLSPQ